MVTAEASQSAQKFLLNDMIYSTLSQENKGLKQWYKKLLAVFYNPDSNNAVHFYNQRVGTFLVELMELLRTDTSLTISLFSDTLL